MHNAVYPLSQEILDMVAERRKEHGHRKEKVVTFLGRITMQKDRNTLLKLLHSYYSVHAISASAWQVRAT